MANERPPSPTRYLRALQRRVDFLARLDDQGLANGFDNSERRALNWAVSELCNAHNIDRSKVSRKPQ